MKNILRKIGIVIMALVIGATIVMIVGTVVIIWVVTG
jgi:amino acid transporter